MLPAPLRKLFYKLHSSKGFTRKIADILSWLFMASVRLFRIPPPYDKSPLTIVSHKYKFIYIGIPKTATRSFVSAFYYNGKDVYETEMFETKRDFQKALKRYPDYFKFSFTRHPYDRALSCYNSKIGHEDLSLLKKARIMSFYRDLSPGMSFESFASWLVDNKQGQDRYSDRHWLSQYNFLHDENGSTITNALGRYENLESDLQYIMKTIEAPCPELKKAGWVSKENKHEKEISKDVQDLLYKRYEKDFKAFGYKP